MKLLLLTVLLSSLTNISIAQKPCTVTKDQLPEFRKLRLGMERSEFEKHYPGASILVMKRHATDKLDFEGLDGIAFDFHNNRLYFVEYDFDRNVVKWASAKEFAKNTSENLKIPYDAWRFELGDFVATMACADFFVRLNSKNPYLSVRDTVADKAKKAEERKNAEEKKKTLKP